MILYHHRMKIFVTPVTNLSYIHFINTPNNTYNYNTIFHTNPTLSSVLIQITTKSTLIKSHPIFTEKIHNSPKNKPT